MLNQSIFNGSSKVAIELENGSQSRHGDVRELALEQLHVPANGRLRDRLTISNNPQPAVEELLSQLRDGDGLLLLFESGLHLPRLKPVMPASVLRRFFRALGATAIGSARMAGCSGTKSGDKLEGA